MNFRVCIYLEKANFTPVCFFCSRKRPCQSHTSSDCDRKAFDVKRMKHGCNVSVIFPLNIIRSKKSPRLIFLSFIFLFTEKASYSITKTYLSFVYLFVYRKSVLFSCMERTNCQVINFASLKNSHWGRVSLNWPRKWASLKQLRRCTPSIALQLAGSLTMSN